VSGCAITTQESNGDEDSLETGEVSSAVTILPVQGFWRYAETQNSTNCNLPVPPRVTGTFFIDLLSTTSYRVFPGDGGPAFLCSLSDGFFSCPNRLVAQDAITAPNAVLTLTFSALGAYSDSRHGQGKQDVAVACSGPGCGAVGLPCGFVRDFSVTA